MMETSSGSWLSIAQVYETMPFVSTLMPGRNFTLLLCLPSSTSVCFWVKLLETLGISNKVNIGTT
jgi:hypothetical protein